MAHEKISKQINKFAVLVHQLWPEDKCEALSYFSKESIEQVTDSPEGLQIFFKEYDLTRKSIIRQKIEVKGLFYKIYPLVTNLTIHGIGPHATNSLITGIMQSYGFIIDSYRVQETVERGSHKTTFLTNDYRIVLDIPEVFANFNLTPLSLPNMRDRTFEVSFFCRLCRHNGHMQFQCPNAGRRFSSSTTSHQNIDGFRRLSSEYITSDSVICQNRTNNPHSHLCVDPQNYNERSDSLKKSEIEQNYFSYQNLYSKQKSHKNGTPKNFFVKSTFSNSKNCQRTHNNVDNMNARKKHRQDLFSSISMDDSEKFRGKNSTVSNELSSKVVEKRRSFDKRNFHQQYGNGKASSDECSNKQTSVVSYKSKKTKKNLQDILSLVLPPNADLLEAKKLLKIALKPDIKDIPAKVEAVLLNILNYNGGLKKEEVDIEVITFLNLVKVVLKKIEKGKIQGEKFHTIAKNCNKSSTKEQRHVKDGKSTSERPKQQSCGRRNVNLSLGITKAISLTVGELEPKFLRKFLNQARCRKKVLDIASFFTKNIPALASQLLEVQNVYYKYVENRGPEEDRDISYIKRLRQRLLQHTTHISLQGEAEMTVKSKAEMTVKSEAEMTVKSEAEMTVKSEADMTEMSLKTEADMAEIPVKKEEIFMRQTRDDGNFVDKNLPSKSQYTTNVFTNGTRMPLVAFIKTEVDDID